MHWDDSMLAISKFYKRETQREQVMRFRKYQRRSSTMRQGDRATTALPPGSAPQWRSLWTRVYGRWTRAPAAPVSEPTHTTLSPGPSDRKPHQAPIRASHVGFRGYFHRKRGDLWFLTKRNHDCDLHAGDASDMDILHVEELEVPPPPTLPAPLESAQRGGGRRGLFRLKSSSKSSRGSTRSCVCSEIAIAMSSYSSDSQSLSSFSASDCSSSSSSVSLSDEAASEDPRDSYAVDKDDPFMQRYSSLYSMDGDHDSRASGYDDEEEEADERTPHPFDDNVYEVRYVDIGGTTTPILGIWV